MGRRRLTLAALVAGAVAIAVAIALWLGGGGAAPDAGPRTTISHGPGEPPGMSDFERACERLDTQGALAHVVFARRLEMTRDVAAPVTAAVTLAHGARLRRMLRSQALQAEPGIVVSCILQARLSGAPQQFALDRSGWIERSLLATSTVRWSWYVTPEVEGTHTLTLSLRPIVALGGARIPVSLRAARDAVRQYPIDAHVTVPGDQRALESMRTLTTAAKGATDLVDALKGLLVALLALGAVVFGVVRHRRRRSRAR